MEISAAIDPEVEVPAIGNDKFLAYLESNIQIKEDLEMTPEDIYQAKVVKAWRQDHPVRSLANNLPEFEEMESNMLKEHGTSEDDLIQLAVKRKQAIRRYLVDMDKITPERVFIREDNKLEISTSGTSEARLTIK